MEKEEKEKIIKTVFAAIILCCTHIILKDRLNLSNIIKDNIHFVCIIVLICSIVFLYFCITKPFIKIIKYYFEDNKINWIDYSLVFLEIIQSYALTLWIKYWLIIFTIYIFLGVLGFLRIDSRHREKVKLQKTNLYMLKDLSKANKQTTELSEFILVEEKAIEKESDDLLDVSSVRKNIQDLILKCNPSKTFVLGLIGEWGIGKTSTIKLVEESLKKYNNLKIKYFNPWNYENNIDMLEAFLNLLSSMLEENNNLEITKSFNKYKKMLYKVIDEKIGVSIFSRNDEEEQMLKYKKTIDENLLKELNKYIIVIDNLDRISRKQLDFFFSIINNMLNFKGLIYILCYDEKNLKKILSRDNNYGLDFMDKIINAKIYMPFIDLETLSHIGRESIKNILNKKELTPKTKLQERELDDIINIISEDMGNLRTLTRFINSLSLNLTPLKKYDLYISDYICLEYIKFANHELYKYIYNHRDYFYEKRIIEELDDLVNIINGNKTFNTLLYFAFDIRNQGYEYYIRRVTNDALENRLSNPRVIGAYFCQKGNTNFTFNNEIILFIIDANKKSKNKAKESLNALISKYKEGSVYSEISRHYEGIKNRDIVLECCLDYGYNEDLYNFIRRIVDDSTMNTERILRKFSKKHTNKFLAFSSQYCSENKYNFEKIQIIKDLVNQILIQKNSRILYDTLHNIRENVSMLFELANEKVLIDYLNKNLNINTIIGIISVFIVESRNKEKEFEYECNYENLYKYVDKEKLEKVLKKIDYSFISAPEKRILDIFSKGKKTLKKQISFDFKLTVIK